MTAYQTVVVGTDGSETSLRAVDHAAALAAESNAKLIIATGHLPQADDLRAADILKNEGYKVRGNAPIYEILREASERAKAAGARNVETRPIRSTPTKALVKLAKEIDADLLVVGNVGLDKVLGRWLSLPGNLTRKAKTEVLVVNTTGHHDGSAGGFRQRVA